MPLFRSHAGVNGETAASGRRSDLDRRFGCIAALFQVFDPQIRARQIAGPRRDVPASLASVPASQHPSPLSSAESSALAASRAKEDDKNCPAHCRDSKVVSVPKGSAATALLSELSMGNRAPHSSGPIQSTSNSEHKVSMQGNLSHKDKPPRPLSTAAVALAKDDSVITGTMARQSSSTVADISEPETTSFPPKQNVTAYPAGGRRLKTKGSTITLQNDSILTSEEEKSASWSSPSSDWSSYDRMLDQQMHVTSTAVRRNGSWLPQGGKVEEGHCASENSLQAWKQSLISLSRLKEDGDAGISVNHSRLAVLTAPPGAALRNELTPPSPARASAFDFKDVVQWTQRTSLHSETFARRSWDDRDLPQSITELRNAINARARAISAASAPASTPASPRTPSVVARLMGLDNLPQEQPPVVHSIEKKPSGEAKLLQQLLQCSPAPAQSTLHPNSAIKLQFSNTGRREISAHHSALSSPSPDGLAQSDLQSMLNRVEEVSLHGRNSTSNASEVSCMSKYRRHSKYFGLEPLSIQQAHSLKNNKPPHYMPVVAVKQSEEILSPLLRSSRGYHDEIEDQLRQLGLQSSEQERKTLKQILESMQQKGLLNRPEETADQTKGQGAVSSMDSLAHLIEDGAVTRSPSPTVLKPGRALNVGTVRSGKHRDSASIVIMRPTGKSTSRSKDDIENQVLITAKAPPLSSKAVKIGTRKARGSVRSESCAGKESTTRIRQCALSSLQIDPTLLHAQHQICKLPLKVHQNPNHPSKNSPRGASTRQPFLTNTDMTIKRRSSIQQAAHPLELVNCNSVTKNKLVSSIVDEVEYADISDFCVRDYAHSNHTQFDCLSSDGSLGNLLPEEMTINEDSGMETPPGEFKLDRRFGEIGGHFIKVAEQGSPVSVLDMSHLSGNEVMECTDEYEEGCPRGCQDDNSSGDHRQSDKACVSTLSAIPVSPQKLMSRELNSLGEAHACSAEISGSHEDSLFSFNHEDAYAICEDNLLPEFLPACTIIDGMTNGVGPEIAEILNASKKPAHSDTLRIDCKDSPCENGDAHSTQIRNVPITDIEGNINRLTEIVSKDGSDPYIKDYVHSIQKQETDCPWIGNVDYCYIEDVLRAVGVKKSGQDEWSAAKCWLGEGCKMSYDVYRKLEEQWDALEDEQGYAEDRDFGGELYLKSQQAAMRRRLLFDSVDEVLEKHFSWVGIPGASGCLHSLLAGRVWNHFQQLEGPCSVEDSMYAMLQQDLIQDAASDYSVSHGRKILQTSPITSVAFQLEHDILNSLLLEALDHSLVSSR